MANSEQQTAQNGPVRRVVVAEGDNGKSFVASDTPVAGLDTPGIGALYTLWGNDAAGHFPDDGAAPPFSNLYPPVGGFRVYLSVFPVGMRVSPQADRLSGGGALTQGATVPGMHKSDTTDFDFVIKGRIDCILTDGTVIHLKAGDTLVLNGADHAWRNVGDEEAHVLFFMAGAERG